VEPCEQYLVDADHALRENHAGEALSAIRCALRLQPENALALALMALTYVRMGEEVEARVAVRKATEAAPRNSKVRHLAYLALGQLRDLEAARAQLTYFCELEPTNTSARGQLSRMGGPVMGLPPLPRAATVAIWYDGGGGALAGAGDLEGEDSFEPPPGPDVVLCVECQKRCFKGWVCKHCGANLPRPI
jgi:hypothetical protein